MPEPRKLHDRLRNRLAALGGAVLLATLTACGGSQATGPVSGVTGGEDDGMNGAVLDQPYQVSPTPLTSTDGSPYSLTKDTEKPLTLVFFGYTHCPDICQLVMGSLASAFTRLTPEQRDQVEVVFVTTDPARDDAKVLRDYLDQFDPSFEGLTGDLGTISKVASSMRIAIEKGQKLPSGGYDVTHGTAVLGVGDSDEADIVWTEGTSAAQFTEDITSLLEQ